MRNIIAGWEDLCTRSDETKAGFIEIANRKSLEATYYVSLGEALRSAAKMHNDPQELVEDVNLLKSMGEAAGISTKASHYLEPEDVKTILRDFIDIYLSPHGSSFDNELVSRYLLTQGDALGGRMRNIVGKMAGEKLTRGIIAALQIRDIAYEIFLKEPKSWVAGQNLGDDIISQVRAIKWQTHDQDRLLCYDLTVPIVKKNIDIVIFNNSNANIGSPKEFRTFISNAENYLSLGELKGGIDPAGADEHWKTAGTALQRIRDSFGKANKPVNTFFVGAAIETAMAKEMFDQWGSGQLTLCANLTKTAQLTALCDWIVLT